MRAVLLLTVVLLVGICAIFPGQVAAASAPHGEAAHAAAGEGETKGEGGIFQVALDLFIWTIVVFLLLLAVLGKFAWGPMLEGLKKREENIRAAIEDAQKAREEAQTMRAQLQAEIDKAHEKERQIVEEAHKNAQRVADEIVAKARAEVTAEKDRARREVEMAKDQALQQLSQHTALLATAVASKLIQRQVSADDHRRLVDDALREMKTNGKA